MPTLLQMQWMLVGFFVLIHFLLGMKRGTAKSAWFLLAYVVTATLTIVMIAQFTLTWFFTTQESMVGIIDWANGLAGGILSDFRNYYADPAITPVIFMILDLVFKIILYAILFPIVRWLLTLIIFRPIWKHIFLKRMLAKQNEALELEHEEMGNNKKFKKKKKLKLSLLSRFSGGLIGGVRGVLVAFVALLPLLVFSSFIGKLDPGSIPTLSDPADATTLSNGSQTASPYDEIDKYLQEIDEMNAGGFGQITNAITVNGVSFDRYVFDSMFTPIINDPTIQNASVNFIQELENIIDVASIILNNGYLDRDWSDLSTIDDNDIANAQLIIQTIGKSDLLSYLLTSGLEKAPELIPTLVTTGPLADIDWTSDTLQATLQYLVDTNWQEEFNRVAALVGALSDFMSPAEIIALMDDPSALANLDADQITALIDVIRAVGNLHLLAALNLGIEYAIMLPEMQQSIAWADDPEAYLREKLAFILGYDEDQDPDNLYHDGPSFFIGEDGQISKIADLLELVLTDSTVDLVGILNSGGNIEEIIAAQTETFVTALFTQLADMELIVNGLPIGVDFALYLVGGDQIADELAGDLAISLAEIDWGHEIENIGDIYNEALKLSIETIFAEDPDMLAYADMVMGDEDNVTSLKAIVSAIFESSDLVGSALEMVAPFAIDNMIADDGLKTIVQGVLLDANEDFDFNIGQEINNIITVAEELNKVIKFTDLGAFSESSLDDKLALVSAFGDMLPDDYTAFRTALTSLQILTKVDETVFGNIISYLDMTDTVYTPSDMLLSDDIGTIIDFAHDAAAYLSANHTVGVDGGYEDIDLTGFLPTIKDFLTSTDDRSDLIFYNIVNQLQKLANEGSLSEYLTIPDSLPIGSDQIENTAWDTEISALIGAVFDIATSIGEVDGVTLSASGVQSYMAVASGLPIEVITKFADVTEANAAFGNLDNSLILRASVTNLIDSQGASLSDSLFGHVLATPAHLVNANGVLEAGAFTDLINGVATLLDDMNQTMGFTTIGELRGNDISVFLQAFNQTDDASIDALMSSSLIHGIISDLITDPLFQQGLADTINDAQDLFTVDATIFGMDPLLLDAAYAPTDVLVTEEATNILLMLKAMQLSNFEDIGLDMFTEMFDRNIDVTTGHDDFDRFLSSGYIYSVIDGILQDPAVTNLISDQLGPSLGIDMSTLDLTLPVEMLGQQSDADLGNIDQIEVGRLPKAEFRKVFTSISLVDMEDIGINTFTSLVSPVESPDDFTTFIDSDFIYFILASLIGFDGFSNYIGEQLAGSFGDMTLDVTVPIDAKGSQADADADLIDQLEVNRISRNELRSIMISFSMIDIENPGIGSLLGLFEVTSYIPESADPLEDRDNDFYQFVDSKFLQSMISQLLLDDFIIDTIAGTDSATPLFNSADFDIPAPALYTPAGGSERLSKDEIFYIFNGLKELGISDNFDDIDLGLNTIKSIDDEALLKSEYLYAVLNLAISGQASLTIPADAFALTGDYAGMITKDEIHKLFVAVNTLPPETDPTDLQIDTITNDQIMSVINAESKIINQMISDQVVTALNNVVAVPIDNVSLPEAYETIASYPTVVRLKTDEMRALVVTMSAEVLNITSLSESFAITSVTVNELQNLHDLGLGEDQVGVAGYDYDSYIIHYLITDQIEKDATLNVNQLTLPEAYNDDSGYTRLNADEIQALIQTMDELGIDFNLGFSMSSVTSTDLLKVHYLGLGDDPNASGTEELDSYIIHKLITEQIEADATLNVDQTTVPEAYFENSITLNDWMEPLEVEALIIAMGPDVLNIDFNTGFTINAVTSDQLMKVHYLGLGAGLVGTYTTDYDSYIIHKLITEQIEADLTLNVDETTVPEAYYVDAKLGNTWMDPLEVEALIIAMGTDVLNINFSTGFSISSVTSDQLMQVHYLGLGAGLVGTYTTDYKSYIIHKLITEQIEADLTLNVDQVTVPEAYYVDAKLGNTWMDPLEVEALIIAMGTDVLNIDFNTGFSISTVTSDQLMQVHYLGLGTGLVGTYTTDYDSYIIHKLITEQIEADLTLNVDETTVPEAYYVDAKLGNTWMKPLEVEALIIAMGTDALNINFSTGFSISTVTSTQLMQVHYLGLGTGLVGTYTTDYESYIIHKLITEQIENDVNLGVDQLTVPEAYYVDPTLGNTWMAPEEVEALIIAMGTDVLNIDFNTGFSVSTISSDVLMDVHYLGLGTGLVGTYTTDYESYIIHKLITEQIESDPTLNVSQLTIPEAYFQEPTTLNYWMKAKEVEALITAMGPTVLNIDFNTGFSISTINSSVLMDVHYLGLGDDPDVVALDELDSYIIHKMITDQIEADLTLNVNQGNLPEAYYVDATLGNTWMKPLEVEALIIAMSPDVLDINFSSGFSVSSTSKADLLNIHYLGLGTGLVGTYTTDYESYIIHKMVSSQIESALTVDQLTIPEAYDLSVEGNYWMKPLEVEALIQSMDVIGILDFGSPVSITTVGLSDLQDLHYLGLGTGILVGLSTDYESYIIHNLMTEQIETALSVDDTSVPEAYTSASGTSRMEADEIQALLDAMGPTVLGFNDLSGSFALSTITVGKLKLLDYIGLGDPTHLFSAFDSYLIHNLLSDNIAATLDEPSTAHMNDDPLDYMEATEVTDVIEAMIIINGGNDTAQLGSFGTINDSSFTRTVLGDLIALDSLTVYRLISTGFISSGIATLESYADALEPSTTYDPLDPGKDMKEEEIVGVYDAMVILNINDITEVLGITVADVTGKTDGEIDTLFNNNNTILYFIIDDLIDPGSSNPLFLVPRWTDESLSERVDRAELIQVLKDAE